MAFGSRVDAPLLRDVAILKRPRTRQVRSCPKASPNQRPVVPSSAHVSATLATGLCLATSAHAEQCLCPALQRAPSHGPTLATAARQRQLRQRQAPTRTSLPSTAERSGTTLAIDRATAPQHASARNELVGRTNTPAGVVSELSLMAAAQLAASWSPVDRPHDAARQRSANGGQQLPAHALEHGSNVARGTKFKLPPRASPSLERVDVSQEGQQQRTLPHVWQASSSVAQQQPQPHREQQKRCGGDEAANNKCAGIPHWHQRTDEQPSVGSVHALLAHLVAAEIAARIGTQVSRCLPAAPDVLVSRAGARLMGLKISAFDVLHVLLLAPADFGHRC